MNPRRISRISIFAALLMLTFFSPTPASTQAGREGINDPLINEFVANHTGTDVAEFIEVYGDPGVDYSNFWVLEIEGDDASAGLIDDASVQVGTTAGNGIWVSSFFNSVLENGSLTLLVVENFTGSVGDDIDTDNDGVIDTVFWSRIVDDVGVNDGGVNDLTYSTTELTPGYDGEPFAPGGASRLPNGIDTDTTGDWVRNDFDGYGLPGFPGTPEVGEAENTPGGVNAPAVGGPTVVINEIDYDQPGTDEAEFVEIMNIGVAPVSLDGMFLEFVNGNGAVVYDTILLPNVMLAAGDYFVVCANAATVANCDLDDDPDTNFIQNGAPDAIALWLGTNLLDTVSYEGDTAPPYTEGNGTTVGDDPSLTGVSLSRCPDGSDTDDNDTDFGLGTSTPGAANECASSSCDGTPTLIHVIQGSGPSSPEVGNAHEIAGIVVGDFQDTATGLSGFFVQEENVDADGDPLTSEGIFVYDNGFGVDVAIGDEVQVGGTVTEFFDLTELTAVTCVNVLSSGNPLPAAASLFFPLSAVEDLEAFEGMRVDIDQELTATDNFTWARYGEVTLSVGGRQYSPTHIVAPGAPALALQDLNDRTRIQLDDGSLVQNPLPLPPHVGPGNTLRAGDTLPTLTGVLSFAFSEYEIHPTGPVTFTRVNDRPAAPDPVGGSLTVASFNVLNYFTTIDNGNPICGPLGNLGCRGADTPEEFTRQRDKIINALLDIDADIVGLMELENDAANVALADLVDGLNAIAGAGTYEYIATGPIGTDAIRVALIYQPASVSPVGSPAILDSSVDPNFLDTKNRPTLAQTFEENATGEMLTVAVNHFKSKGSPCDDVGDPDTGDGQGNCNLTRTNAAIALANWLAGDPTGSGDQDFLIIGDLNSYAMEDPITALKNAGYDNLLDSAFGAAAYSYVFFGQAGYLDYAMANPALLPQVTGVTAWHINADEPSGLDYNDYNQPLLYTADPYRSSDHDPIIIGLDLVTEEFLLFMPLVGRANPNP